MTDAQTLAFEYLRRSDKKLSPAQYLLELRKLEAEFTELLQIDDLEQKLKDDSMKTWKALSS
ncbi:YdiH family protein [Photorhabdus sp. SF281]|uniref:YdiH family protein n=1 Tax=Photorhabdus sp. SF281 TaxID=3459527 RepID=UPI004044A667